ncbi:MAG: hypothetical protein IPM38_05050 [Ignavibacteria bacterium]|nr:hypothetical protein [Ignavibacteria bacterium]
MNKNLFTFIIIFITVFFFSSCNLMKKNVMNDVCDDVEEAVISKSNGKYALITKENFSGNVKIK